MTLHWDFEFRRVPEGAASEHQPRGDNRSISALSRQLVHLSSCSVRFSGSSCTCRAAPEWGRVIPCRDRRSSKDAQLPVRRDETIFSQGDTRGWLRSCAYGIISAEKTCGKSVGVPSSGEQVDWTMFYCDMVLDVCPVHSSPFHAAGSACSVVDPPGDLVQDPRHPAFRAEQLSEHGIPEIIPAQVAAVADRHGQRLCA